MPRGRVTRPRLRQCSARGEPSGSVFRDRTPDPVVLDSDPNPLPKQSHVPGRFPPNPAHPKAGGRVPSPEVRLPADCLEPHPSYVISQQIRGPQPPNPLGSHPAGLGLSSGTISSDTKAPAGGNAQRVQPLPLAPHLEALWTPHFPAALTTAKAPCKAGVALFKVAWRKL